MLFFQHQLVQGCLHLMHHFHLKSLESQKEKLFFKMAFKSDDQNCLRDHDFELILAFYSDRIQEKSGKPLSEDLKFLLEMYCQGSIYMTVQWEFGRVKRTPEELAADLVKAMPEELAGVFERLDLL